MTEAEDLESRLLHGMCEAPRTDPVELGQRLAKCLPASYITRARARDGLRDSVSAGGFLNRVQSWLRSWVGCCWVKEKRE